MPNERALIGAAGEEAAVDYLRRNGFMIVERNFRLWRYETDIIASRWGVLHFVEVKTRNSNSWVTAEETIDDRKRRSMRRSAAAYIALVRHRGEIEFDLIAVESDGTSITNIRMVENIID